MILRPCLGLIACLLLITPTAHADSLVKGVSGFCTSGVASFDVQIDFNATGGDFGSGTGTADLTLTLANTTPVIPFSVPAVGNPVMTGFFFNLPAGVSVGYSEARLLAGGTLVSTGTNINGIPIPAGCQVLPFDLVQTDWYKLEGSSATGEFGIFTNALTTLEGIKAGMVNAATYAACVAQGDVFSPVFVAGNVQFTLSLSNLDTNFDTAAEMLTHCTVRPEIGEASSVAGKFQGVGADGQDSCFIADPCLVPVEASSWGAIKSNY